jgi:hypothetical protein
MLDPAEMLRLAVRVSPRLFLWTHYYEAERILANPPVAAHFPSEHGPPFRYEYAPEDRIGGGSGFSYWLDRATILGLLDEFGLNQIEIGIEEPDHPNGPAFALIARREKSWRRWRSPKS